MTPDRSLHDAEFLAGQSCKPLGVAAHASERRAVTALQEFAVEVEQPQRGHYRILEADARADVGVRQHGDVAKARIAADNDTVAHDTLPVEAHAPIDLAVLADQNVLTERDVRREAGIPVDKNARFQRPPRHDEPIVIASGGQQVAAVVAANV